MNRLVAALGTAEDRRWCLAHTRYSPAVAGQVANWPNWLDQHVVAAWQALGVELPWLHQVLAMEAVEAGQHTVVATGTGSGKSLALWAPVLSTLADAGPPGVVSALRERSCALYLAPTKALAADQLAALRSLLAAGGLDQLPVGCCDGDSERAGRDWAISQALAVLTNPDYLHFSLLPNHQRWARLLRGLRYVIVDELHAYRGVAGAHVSMVLRRLQRLAASYGSQVQFLLASATLSDPAASAARLTGLASDQITAITQDTAAVGGRTQVVWKPMVTTAGGSLERGSATQAAAQLTANLVDVGARTVTFVRSRSAAETVAGLARRLASSAAGRRIASYRGGYLASERRELERGLRDGSLLAVVATSALELGIDVAGLDAVITAGWPGTKVALTQQAGRTGRAGADGLSIWVAGTDPLDSYLLSHPEVLFDGPAESLVFDPTNPYVMAPHLCAAASELAITDSDSTWFGPVMQTVLAQLTDQGVLRHRPSGWHWVLDDPASQLTDLRGAGGQPVQLVEATTGRVLGTVDLERAPATAFPGAVYLHQGQSFLVEALDLATGVALVTQASLPYTTRAIKQSSVQIVQELDRAQDQAASWHYGQIEVNSQVVGFERLGTQGQGKLGTFPLDGPVQTLPTTAVWCQPDQEITAKLPRQLLPGALHAAEHTAIGLLPLLAACDRWDLGGLSTLEHQQTGGPTIFIHDALPGGAGLARQAFSQRSELLEATGRLLQLCPCEVGCPSCIQSPKCGNGNQVLSKSGALTLVGHLIGPN